MKKNNLFEVFFLLLIIAIMPIEVYSQKWVSKKVEKRKVVLEEFTGIHCGFCPDGHKIANNIAANNPDKVYLVNIHTGAYATPSGGELDLRTADGDAIGAGMRPTGFPTAVVSRELFDMGGSTQWFLSRSYWADVTQQILQDDAPVNIAVKARLNPDTRNLIVEVELYYTSDCEENNYITVMLTQNNIFGTQAGAGNLYPENIIDGKYRHNHVLRKILSNNGYAGDVVTQTKAGHYEYRKYEWILPASIKEIPLVVEDLEVVAHVTSNIAITAGTYKTPMKIYNSAASKVSTSSIEDLPKLALVEVFTSASSPECATLNKTEGFDNYLKSNANKIIPVVYHTGTQGADPMYDFDNSFSYQRAVNYYSAVAVPSIIVDGAKISPNTKVATEDAIGAANKASSMSMLANSSIDNTGKLKVDIGINSQEAFTNLALRVVVVEAGVFFNESAGSNGERDFCFVARHMLPNATGTNFGIASGGTRNFNFEKQLDLTKLNKNNIYVVVFVQNEADKKILQTIATKKIEFLSIETNTNGNIYSKITPGAQKLHTFEIKNTSNVPITVTLIPKEPVTDWEYQPEAPNTKIISPSATASVPYGTKCSSGDASVFASGYEISITSFTPTEDFDNGIAVYSPSKKINFIDITNNAKSAYIYGDIICSDESATNNINAFTSNENSFLLMNFVAIPLYSEELFTGNILDDFDFVGLTINSTNSANGGNNSEELIKIVPTVLAKLSNLINSDKKIYFSATRQLDIASQQKSKYPTQSKTITDFYKNQFGVTNSETRKLYNNSTKIIPASESEIFTGEYKLLSNSSNEYLDIFTSSGVNNAGIFKTDADNKIVAIRSNNVYDETKNKRVLFGFDLGLSVENFEDAATIANQTLCWLFGKDAETSIHTEEILLNATTNNIKIALATNIISSNLNLTVNNTNTKINNMEIYLLDMSGSIVENIYSGSIVVGDNYYELNTNLSNGKYFLVVDTYLGRTYLPLIISK